MIASLFIAFLDPQFVTYRRDFILEKEYSTDKQREIAYMAASDINKASGCQLITIKTVAFVDFDHNIITFNPDSLTKEEENDLAMTFQRGPLVKIGIRDFLRNEKLYYVFIHELGHSLSLDHILNRRDVMFPYVYGATPEVSDHHKIKKKWRYLWSHQIAKALRKKNPDICTAR